jgi:hypothetical protein
MSIIPWHARWRRAQFGNAQAIIRCGEPVQLQLWVWISPAIAQKSTLLRAMGV